MKYHCILLLSFALAPVPGRGVEDPAQKLFAERVGPLLRERCVICHNADAKSGGLDMSTREAFLRGLRVCAVISGFGTLALALFAAKAFPRQPALARADAHDSGFSVGPKIGQAASVRRSPVSHYNGSATLVAIQSRILDACYEIVTKTASPWLARSR